MRWEKRSRAEYDCPEVKMKQVTIQHRYKSTNEEIF
jgi:hypothetical protein